MRGPVFVLDRSRNSTVSPERSTKGSQRESPTTVSRPQLIRVKGLGVDNSARHGTEKFGLPDFTPESLNYYSRNVGL